MSTTTDFTAIESIENGVAIEIYKSSGIDTSPESREEAFQIANSLGLQKQQDAYKSEQGMLEWPVATGELTGILCVCFQKNQKIESFDGPIPIGVIREYERLRNFCDKPDSDYILHHVTIRSPQESASPDPVMFALISRTGESSWSGKWHIVARWGSALLPISELREIAKETCLASLVKIRNQVEAEIKTIQESPRPVFNIAPTEYDFDSELYGRLESKIS